MPENIKLLIFYEGDRGMLTDTYLIQGTQIFVSREEVDNNTVRWTYLAHNAAGEEVRHPIAAYAEMQVLALKTKEAGVENIMFSEQVFNLHEDLGLAIKRYPFSWEASQ